MSERKIPPGLAWAAAIAGAMLVLWSAWDRVDKFFEARTVNKQRHEKVDQALPKVEAHDEQLRKLTEISEQATIQSKGVVTWVERAVADQAQACERAELPKPLCERFFKRHDLPNTYGTKAEEEDE